MTHAFDVTQYHIDYLHYPISRRIKTPHVKTLHGRLELVGLTKLYKEFDEVPLVSTSQSQSAPHPFVNWQAKVSWPSSRP